MPLDELDHVIASMIKSGTRSLPGVELAVVILTSCILQDGAATVHDFSKTVELLLKVAQRHPQPTQAALLVQLVEQVIN